MKAYLSIPGPNKAPRSPCICFYKYDGSNLRFEYSKKRGWDKFGTRHRLFDKNDPEFSKAIPLFLETYGDALPKIVKSEYRIDNFIAYCEFFGPSSIAGWHNFEEEHEVVLLDINLMKKGFILPRDFIKKFGHLKIPKVVYEGNFNKKLIQDVRNGEYDLKEGLVAKGVLPKKNPQHGLWMSKIKTLSWLEDLKRKAEIIDELKKELAENLEEQKNDDI